jgi:hypothetical protein
MCFRMVHDEIGDWFHDHDHLFLHLPWHCCRFRVRCDVMQEGMSSEPHASLGGRCVRVQSLNGISDTSRIWS